MIFIRFSGIHPPCFQNAPPRWHPGFQVVVNSTSQSPFFPGPGPGPLYSCYAPQTMGTTSRFTDVREAPHALPDNQAFPNFWFPDRPAPWPRKAPLDQLMTYVPVDALTTPPYTAG